MPKLERPRDAPPSTASPGTDDTPRVPKRAARSSGTVMRSVKLAPLDDAQDYVNALFYGREGSGKTTALAAMANLGPTVIINAEGGLKRRALQRMGIDTSKILLYPDPRTGERLTFEGLQALYQTLYADLSKTPGMWAGVGMDSITDVATSVLDEVSDKRVSEIQRRGDDVDPWWTDRNDYGNMGKQMRHLLRRFRDLPCHFVATALERRDQDEDTGEVAYGPAVNPGLANDLLGYVDLVLAFKAADDRGPYRAATKNARRWRVKDRFGLLPEVMANPDILRILAYLDGELEEAADEDQKLIPVKKSGKIAVPESDEGKEDTDDA